MNTSQNETIVAEIRRRAREDRHEPVVPQEMIEGFFRRKVDEVRRARVLFQEHNTEEVRKFLHQWKGNCEPYGLGFMGERSRVMEEAFRAQCFDRVEEEFEFIDEYLRLKRQEFEM